MFTHVGAQATECPVYMFIFCFQWNQKQNKTTPYPFVRLKKFKVTGLINFSPWALQDPTKTLAEK